MGRHGLTTYPTHLEGRCWVRFRGRTATAKGDGFERALPISAQLQLLALMLRLESLAKRVWLEAPRASPRSEALDGKSLASWIARRTPSRTVQQLFELACGSLFCAGAAEVSLLFFLFYLRSGGGLETLLGAQGEGAQRFLVEGGLNQLTHARAQTLGDALHLDQPVTLVVQRDGHVVVETARQSFSARRAILTAPPPQLSRVC